MTFSSQDLESKARDAAILIKRLAYVSRRDESPDGVEWIDVSTEEVASMILSVLQQETMP